MSDGFEIEGKKMKDSALYPWSVGSLARALLFFAQAQQRSDRRALATISIYYALFHLGMFLIFSCPKNHIPTIQSQIQNGLERGGKRSRRARTNDPGFELKHKDVENFLQNFTRHAPSNELLNAFISAQALREFINYGPRIDWKGADIYVDTCEHRSSELLSTERLERMFHDSIKWACEEGADDGFWVPQAISDTKIFFSGTSRFYSDWCTDDEAKVAESLRALLEKEAHNKIFGKAQRG